MNWLRLIGLSRMVTACHSPWRPNLHLKHLKSQDEEQSTLLLCGLSNLLQWKGRRTDGGPSIVVANGSNGLSYTIHCLYMAYLSVNTEHLLYQHLSSGGGGSIDHKTWFMTFSKLSGYLHGRYEPSLGWSKTYHIIQKFQWAYYIIMHISNDKDTQSSAHNLQVNNICHRTGCRGDKIVTDETNRNWRASYTIGLKMLLSNAKRLDAVNMGGLYNPVAMGGDLPCQLLYLALMETSNLPSGGAGRKQEMGCWRGPPQPFLRDIFPVYTLCMMHSHTSAVGGFNMHSLSCPPLFPNHCLAPGPVLITFMTSITGKEFYKDATDADNQLLKLFFDSKTREANMWSIPQTEIRGKYV